jgi:hypothetical protein
MLNNEKIYQMIEARRRSPFYDLASMEKMRVLVANDPCTYREAITDVLREVRPHIEVNAIKPDALDAEVTRFRPHLVVCSRITAAVSTLLAWVMLYPEGENRAVINTAGEQVMLDNVGFDDLLSAIDRVELLWPELLS